MTDMIYDQTTDTDPIQDAQREGNRNFAKVGSARPSSLLYNYGPGSIMDLPNFSIMPRGLENWDTVYGKMPKIPTITEPRLLSTVRTHLGPQVQQLRAYPWISAERSFDDAGRDIGVPAIVFPQWFRCTGCNLLAPLSRFKYTNTNPYKPYEAHFEHTGCTGMSSARTTNTKGRSTRSNQSYPAVPAPILLTCEYGHLDEFPYDLWVHRGGKCEVSNPTLKMLEANAGRNVSSIIKCASCKEQRSLAEAQSGPRSAVLLPQKCRGRHPHLGAFDSECAGKPTLVMMGSSNLWFPVTQSVIVMPRKEEERSEALLDKLVAVLEREKVLLFKETPNVLVTMAELFGIQTTEAAVAKAVAHLDKDTSESVEAQAERLEKLENWEPEDLLVPEWNFLKDFTGAESTDTTEGLLLTPVIDTERLLHPRLNKVIAVDKLKKVNAVLGFTRLDEMERANDRRSRLVKLTRDQRPTWIPAVEDKGEGVYLQFDLEAIAEWEAEVENSSIWEQHVAAHERNFTNRFSDTAKNVDHLTRMPPPRYWLLHSLAHALIREMAMEAGYGAASLSERIYAWKANPEKNRSAAAGLLICTTASDSEGTLGGLVSLAKPERLVHIMKNSLYRSCRCSSDPVCANRLPKDPEDFLHGAACHSCSFASETSCEKANRFLDRRFMLELPSMAAQNVPGFFGGASDYV